MYKLASIRGNSERIILTIRDKLLAVSDRFSTVWRVIVARKAVTLEKVDEALAELKTELKAELDTLRGELAAQGQNNGLNFVAIDAHARSLDSQIKAITSETQKTIDGLLKPDVERYRKIGDLRGFAWVVYSQNGEDGILKEIFRRIGTTNQFFVEFGVESGVQCNTRYLAEFLGWSGVYFEPSETNFPKLQAMWQANPKIQTYPFPITAQNFEEKLAQANVPKELDLMVIDIDSNDYWVWKALNNWSPRVVVVEYNAFHDPPEKWVMKEDPNYTWNQTTYFGASFTSFYLLGKSKGYRLVGTDPKGVNMFFVREDCMNDQFLDPALHYYFQPFGYLRPPEFDGPHEVI